jgi:hypothetical protein
MGHVAFMKNKGTYYSITNSLSAITSDQQKRWKRDLMKEANIKPKQALNCHSFLLLDFFKQGYLIFMLKMLKSCYILELHRSF